MVVLFVLFIIVFIVVNIKYLIGKSDKKEFFSLRRFIFLLFM